MSSLSPLLLLFLLCHSLHACTPRPLCLAQKQSAKCLFHEDLDKIKLLETSIAASKPMPYTLKEQQEARHDETIICESSGSASTLKEVVIGPSNRYAETEATTSFQTDSPSSLLAEGQRRHTRSMLGLAQPSVEETKNPNSGDTVEDMVEMDYAQPHRKPPIHNEKS